VAKTCSAGIGRGLLDAGLWQAPGPGFTGGATRCATGPKRDVDVSSSAAVVDTDDVGEDRAQIGDDVADDTGVVKAGTTIRR